MSWCYIHSRCWYGIWKIMDICVRHTWNRACLSFCVWPVQAGTMHFLFLWHLSTSDLLDSQSLPQDSNLPLYASLHYHSTHHFSWVTTVNYRWQQRIVPCLVTQYNRTIIKMHFIVWDWSDTTHHTATKSPAMTNWWEGKIRQLIAVNEFNSIPAAPCQSVVITKLKSFKLL